jgi:hypothetical protein
VTGVLRGRRAAVLLVALVALVAALVPAGPAAAATTPPLVEGSTSTARLAVPYPGHSTSFDLRATPRPGSTGDLVLLVDGGTGPLAAGPDALVLALTDDTGRVLAQGTAAELAADPIPLGVLGSEPLDLRGTATLPATAGDALQGQGLTLVLSLVATQDAGDPAAAGGPPAAGGALALTGASGLALVLLALGLAVTGFLLAARRRRSAPAPTEPPE